MNKKVVLTGLFVAVIGVLFIGAAALYQTRLNNIAYSERIARSSPEPPPEIIAEATSRMPVFASLGIELLLCGFLIIALAAAKTAVATVLVLLMLLGAMQVGNAATTYPRWHAGVYLDHPDSSNIRANIDFLWNTLDPSDENGFVGFHIGIERINYYGQREWIEAGFYQNLSGTWIYAGSLSLSEDYTENATIQLTSWDFGETGKFAIITLDGNTFTAWYEGTGGFTPDSYEFGSESNVPIIPPEGGALLLKTLTFNIKAKNTCLAESESTNTVNSLDAHFINVAYYEYGWKNWFETSIGANEPYYVSMISHNEFITGRHEKVEGLITGGGGGYVSCLSCEH